MKGERRKYLARGESLLGHGGVQLAVLLFENYIFAEPLGSEQTENNTVTTVILIWETVLMLRFTHISSIPSAALSS